jgi:hypothetical protein
MAAPETRDSRLDSETGHKLLFQVVHDGNDDAADDGNNNTFTCFPALPPELRLHIWEYLIQPRVVLVAYFDPGITDLAHSELRRQPYKPAIPALLHVNHESRALALRHYEQTFSWMTPGAFRVTRPKDYHAWFNFGLDTLYFLNVHGQHAPFVHGFDSNDLGRVRHVAFAFEALRWTPYQSEPPEGYGMLSSVGQMFSSAQRLLITTWQQDAAGLWPPRPPFPVSSIPLLLIWSKFMAGTTWSTRKLQGKPVFMLWADDLAGFIAEHR